MRVVLGALVSLAALGGLAACTKVSTNPTTVVAIELQAPQLPSVVQSDTLRDTTGLPAPLVAIAFNGHNDTIPAAPFRFIALDTGIVSVDSVTGLVTGRDTIGQARVIATAGTLQSVPVTIQVTRAPDSLQAVSATADTLRYFFGKDSTRTLQVRLSHLVSSADSLVPVPNYLVQFAIVDPAGLPSDTAHVVIVNERRAPVRADTTDAQGTASRQLLVPRSLAENPPDSVIVEVTAFKQDRARTPVPGSPVRFTVQLQPATTK
ncbi:MAG TPA: hypothetical protein VF166_15030 [Gemmatimonadaceae bacterium]